MTKRCAIYTRKSTEEGLDQEFNSLDAQAESCAAYIASQKSEGWIKVKTRYDDGGYSGGNMERPALKQLIADIQAGKIDIVVVYKIDRLTRSLMDFSKLVEVFDKHGVTFVSVTQSFNTTTSMGRLTLNVLLSFAQFEREVTGERIRDKVAASKKKGMWMGGNVPLGYDLKDRRLYINKKEAETVRLIFEKYLELGNLTQLKKLGITTKSITTRSGTRRGGRAFSRGHLYTILTNPIYIGKIRHKGHEYEALHEAIIDINLWEKVQNRLQSHATKLRGLEHRKSEGFLKGKLYDRNGNRYTTSMTYRGKKKHRYYMNDALKVKRGHPLHIMARIPAGQIENLVKDRIKGLLVDPAWIKRALNLKDTDDGALYTVLKYTKTANIAAEILDRVIVNEQSIEIQLSVKCLASLLSEKLSLQILDALETDIQTVPFQTRRADRVILVPQTPSGKSDPFALSPVELKNWVRGIVWRDEFYDGISIEEIAKRENLSARYVGRLIDSSLEIGLSA